MRALILFRGSFNISVILNLRYLAQKRKLAEDEEQKRRNQVLIARKVKQQEATRKFQRNQNVKAKSEHKNAIGM